MTDHGRRWLERGPRTTASRTAEQPPTASTLDGDFSAAPDEPWRTWAEMPSDVRKCLKKHKLEPAKPFLTAASTPRTVKRGSSYYQRASAWAVDRTRLITIDAVRGLEQVAEKQFRLSGPWELTVREFPFVESPRKRAGVVPVTTDPFSQADADGRNHTMPDIIDVLPEPVRRQIHGTVTSPSFEDEFLFQGSLDGFPREHDLGLLRADSSTMIAVHAKRWILVKDIGTAEEATRLLAQKEWDVQTLYALLGEPQIYRLAESTKPDKITKRMRNNASSDIAPST